MFRNINRHFSEEAFLHATFGEFIKCWGSGAKSRLFIESVNGNAFVNFSAYLGHPGDAHFVSKKETKDNINVSPKSKSRGKSKWKIGRDNNVSWVGVHYGRSWPLVECIEEDLSLPPPRR